MPASSVPTTPAVTIKSEPDESTQLDTAGSVGSHSRLTSDESDLASLDRVLDECLGQGESTSAQPSPRLKREEPDLNSLDPGLDECLAQSESEPAQLSPDPPTSVPRLPPPPWYASPSTETPHESEDLDYIQELRKAWAQARARGESVRYIEEEEAHRIAIAGDATLTVAEKIRELILVTLEALSRISGA